MHLTVYRKPSVKPFLTQKQNKRRFEFAKQNRNRDWSKIIFTDESTIRLASIVQRVWRKRKRNFFLRRFKNYSKINIWGCFDIHDFKKIILFKENLNAKKLISIYKNGLLASYPDISNSKWVLLEDNDSKHTSEFGADARNLGLASYSSNVTFKKKTERGS